MCRAKRHVTRATGRPMHANSTGNRPPSGRNLQPLSPRATSSGAAAQSGLLGPDQRRAMAALSARPCAAERQGEGAGAAAARLAGGRRAALRPGPCARAVPAGRVPAGPGAAVREHAPVPGGAAGAPPLPRSPTGRPDRVGPAACCIALSLYCKVHAGAAATRLKPARPGERPQCKADSSAARMAG